MDHASCSRAGYLYSSLFLDFKRMEIRPTFHLVALLLSGIHQLFMCIYASDIIGPLVFVTPKSISLICLSVSHIERTLKCNLTLNEARKGKDHCPSCTKADLSTNLQ